MKEYRQRKIVEIIKNSNVETQEELAADLREAGFSVTQATVSRDIKELGLIKVPVDNNVSKYNMPAGAYAQRNDARLRRLFISSVQGIDHSENLIVIKTLPGEAQGVASAIDHAGWQEVIGTVAGDDTILIIVKPKKMTAAVIKRFQEITGG